MSRETKSLVLEMSAGMLCYVLILGVGAWILHLNMGFEMGPVILGLVAGFVSDVLMLVHMAFITERAADSMDPAYAQKTTVVHAMVRKIVFIVVLVFLGTRPQIDAVAMIIGALGLKAGAFLQPVVHRAFSRGAETN